MGIVTLVLLALGVGLVVGYAGGGRLRWLLFGLPLRRNRLLLTALAVSVLGVLGGWLWHPLLAIMSGLAWLTIAFYAWVNRAVQGAALVAFGLVANGLVLLLNAAVPVSLDAAARAGADPVELLQPAFHEPATADTLLPWLGKSVPVAFPPRPEVVSPGDVVVSAGLALTIATGMRGRRRLGPTEHDVTEEVPARSTVGAAT